ncbi:MAG: NmrA family NAD(P)-binding protein [Bacteroidia bacterium]|nr:NmrA family NAD(P)-binding protein [Bacteroidia bacterium]
MYVITGASGNIGNILSMELLAKGKKVRAIARHADKLQSLADKGAEIAIGDLTDLSFVKHAFVGATAAYCMIPPSVHSDDFYKYQREVADNLFEAVRDNHILYVVLLSSIGAHLRTGGGVVDGLGYMEEKFSTLKQTNVVNLRPSFFMENLFGQIGTIKQMGVAGSPLKGDLKVPMVAVKDIAQMALSYLDGLKFRGNVTQFVLGARDVSYNEVATVLGKAIGKPDLKYIQFSYEDAKKAMVNSGFVSANVAGLYNGLSEAMNNGSALNAHKRTPENTTKTDIEEFARSFAHVYQMS